MGKVVNIPLGICLGMIASAIETYPKECMGAVFCSNLKSIKIETAIPYQIARRNTSTVYSETSTEFIKLNRNGFIKLGDYHSHPYTNKEVLDPLLPSFCDIKDIAVGDIELIIRLHKVRTKSSKIVTKKDCICISWGKFRIQVMAFKKIKKTQGRELFLKDQLLYYSILPINVI